MIAQSIENQQWRVNAACSRYVSTNEKEHSYCETCNTEHYAKYNSREVLVVLSRVEQVGVKSNDLYCTDIQRAEYMSSSYYLLFHCLYH